THRSGGNVALSVSMTAVGNLLYIVAMPLSIAFWGSLHPSASGVLRQVALDPAKMLMEIVLIIGLPFVVGLLVRAKLPPVAARAHPFVKGFSLMALVGFIVVALVGNWAVFSQVLGIILLVVTIHGAVAIFLGYGTAVLGGLR